MTTFVLKKYDEQQEKPTEPVQSSPEQPDPKKDDRDLYVVDGDKTISEIIAKALYKALGTGVNLQETDQVPVGDSQTHVIKTVSTEQINHDPVGTLKSIKKGDVVYIQNRGFKTAKEDWFLSSMEAMNHTVLLTEDSVVRYALNRGTL